VTVQAQQVKDQVRVRAKVWGVVKVGAEWADLRPQDQAEIVYAQAAVQRSLMLLGNLATKEVALNVEQK